MTKREKNSDGFLKNNYENNQTPCNGTGSLHGPLFTSCSINDPGDSGSYNYGVLYLTFRYGDAFNTLMAFLLVAGLTAGGVVKGKAATMPAIIPVTPIAQR